MSPRMMNGLSHLRGTGLTGAQMIALDGEQRRLTATRLAEQVASTSRPRPQVVAPAAPPAPLASAAPAAPAAPARKAIVIPMKDGLPIRSAAADRVAELDRVIAGIGAATGQTQRF